jgi:hypothetical protein
MRGAESLIEVTFVKSRMRESRTYGSVRAKAEWLSYSTTLRSAALTRNTRERDLLFTRAASCETDPTNSPGE